MLACLMLVAFTLQSYVTQTHIHHAASHSDPAKPAGGQACVFCQEMMQAGTFVTPSAATLSLPVTFVTVRFQAIAIAFVAGRVPHGWQGRGPPLR
ncbi:MAG TPA: hypothetical protein VGF56_11620 [Rhizomicrobium sp.]|jgi:hypothetical protein